MKEKIIDILLSENEGVEDLASRIEALGEDKINVKEWLDENYPCFSKAPVNISLSELISIIEQYAEYRTT